MNNIYKQRFYVRFGDKPDDWFYIEFKTKQRYMNGEWIAEKERELFQKYKNAKEVYLVAVGLEM
jgi:hypothetical protein